MQRAQSKTSPAPASDVDPLWYKDAIIYQLHVRSFFDSDNDGIGDFHGLTQKLDYLQDLGVTALWLLPFYPSPLRDDGYDIANYTEVNPAYGNLRAFKTFIAEAHSRGLKVITELVLNHTSDQHPWFQRARRAKPGSAAREFYVWSDTSEKYQDARIIFKDFEVSNWAWDPVAKAYYWHRFYAHQPDLNFENPKVREAMFDALDYWLKLGVDGLRLDAVPYLYERDGTNCENLPETHEFLKLVRRHIDDNFPGRMLLAEANQWPEDAIAYFGDGDECHTAFHFPIMPRLFMAVHMEDRFPIVDILQQTPPIPANCQWIVFLRNHDELTLEMVTDEERDYMYRVYARDSQARINLGIRRRLAPLLGNNRRKIELLNALLCTLPGTPVIYYGDEIGMGDNIYLGDRHGVRTPMQWSPDRNAGFSEANPQRLYSPVIIDSEYLFEAVNVETQQTNPHSLLWWMKRLIGLRQRYPALSRGTLEMLTPENTKILAFTRDHETGSVLMVANLSRFVQFVELDLSRFAGRQPIEIFGQTRFPAIGKTPYVLTLSPHAFYWFALEPDLVEPAATPHQLPRLLVHDSWHEATGGRMKKRLEAILLRELPRNRRFNPGARPIQSVQVCDAIPLAKDDRRGGGVRVLVLQVDYLEGEADKFLLPLDVVWQKDGEPVDDSQATAIARIVKSSTNETGVLFDVLLSPGVSAALLDLIADKRRVKGPHGELYGWCDPVLGDTDDYANLDLKGAMRADGDTSAVFAERWILRFFRGIQAGVNANLEIGRFLAKADPPFTNTLPILGALEYRMSRGESHTIGLLNGYVPHTVSGWHFAQDALSRYFEQLMAQPIDAAATTASDSQSIWELSQGDAPAVVKELLGGSLEWSGMLGRRTGELHLTLVSSSNDANFAPEPFTQLYQRSLYQSSRKNALQTFQKLRRRLNALPPPIDAIARAVLEREKQLLDSLRFLVGQKIAARRFRCHGCLDLRHVLYTGKDFLIVDFEDDAHRLPTAQRLKRAAIKDLADLVNSFDQVSAASLSRVLHTAGGTAESVAALRHGATLWYRWMSSAFLRSYQAVVGDADLLPHSAAHAALLMQLYLAQAALDQLQFELNTAAEPSSDTLERLLDLSRG